jgi:hypothetical protein
MKDASVIILVFAVLVSSGCASSPPVSVVSTTVPTTTGPIEPPKDGQILVLFPATLDVVSFGSQRTLRQWQNLSAPRPYLSPHLLASHMHFSQCLQATSHPVATLHPLGPSSPSLALDPAPKSASRIIHRLLDNGSFTIGIGTSAGRKMGAGRGALSRADNHFFENAMSGASKYL